jgi:outer membrane protein with beta-barrel domain
MRSLVPALVASAVALAAPSALADGPAQVFPLQEHLSVANDANFSLQHTSISGGGGDTSIVLDPAADYFIVDHVSVGGFVEIEHDSTDNTSATTIGVGPRVGYDYPLTDQFSVWPRAGFALASRSTSITTTATVGGQTSSVTESGSSAYFTFIVSAPFLYHPAEHFFLGIGPYLSADLSGDAKLTVVGLEFTVGGYFGI